MLVPKMFCLFRHLPEIFISGLSQKCSSVIYWALLTAFIYSTNSRPLIFKIQLCRPSCRALINSVPFSTHMHIHICVHFIWTNVYTLFQSIPFHLLPAFLIQRLQALGTGVPCSKHARFRTDLIAIVRPAAACQQTCNCYQNANLPCPQPTGNAGWSTPKLN